MTITEIGVDLQMGAALRNLRQPRPYSDSVMIGVQVELRDTQQASLTAGGVGDAP